MGTYGSTRWSAVPTRYETGECLRLDAQAIKPYLSAPAGKVVWSWSDGSEVTMAISTRSSTGTRPPVDLDIGYQCDNEAVHQQLLIDPLPQFFGGWRLWLRCPHCRRRCRYIYLPPYKRETRRFACRQCHRLTYRSSNESHRSDTFIGLIASRCGVSFKTARRLLRQEGYAI